MTSVVQARPARGLQSPVGKLHGYLVRDLARDLRGALLRAVGDKDAGCSLLDEVTRGQLSHLLRADDEEVLPRRLPNIFAGEVYGDRGDGDGGAADRVSVRTRLATREGVQERLQRGGDGTDLAAIE